MTAPPDLAQLILDSGAAVHYGIRIVEIGEQADYLIAAGHVDPRRMVAACNAHSRSDGMRLADLGSLADVLARVHHRMAAVAQPCPGQVHDEDCDACHGSAWGVNWGDGQSGRDTPVTVLEWA